MNTPASTSITAPAKGAADCCDASQHLLTIDRIFGQDAEFKPEEWGPAYWLKKGTGYCSLEVSPDFSDYDKADEIKDLVHYDPATAERSTLVAAARLIPPGQDRPLSIENYAWTEDTEKVLLFTNAQRVWREKTRGDYWLLHRNTGALQQLGGSAPEASMMFATISPDGTRIAYVCENNLYVQNLDDLQIIQLTTDGGPFLINGTADWVNEEEFHLRNGLRWSPDSSSIAYWQFDTTGVQQFPLVNNTDSLYPKITYYAYPKVGQINSACRVGVISAAGGDTLWFESNSDPRNHYIPHMEWSSDSKRVLFQQLNRLQNTNHFISGNPQTGATEIIFTDRDDAWVEVMREWRWIDDGERFLWLSERDGWRHLYAVSIKDPSVCLLTPGDYDVLSLVGVDEKDGCAYFIASPENATQRYLYRAPLDGSGKAARVTPVSQQGTHSYRFSNDGLWAFHTYSRFGQPPIVELISMPDHHVVRVLSENKALNEKLAALTPCHHEFFKVPIEDGFIADAWCIKPPDFDPSKKYPLFIHVYGEPAASTVLDVWAGDNFLWHLMMAQNGYVVVCIDNRGTPAPLGRAWRKSIYRQIGSLASRDQAAATREILRTRPYLDASRVGIWGWSGGGSMSLNAIFRHPDLYHTAMAIAFVANQRFYDTIYQERYMGLPDDNAEGFRHGSPVTFAHQLQGNLLLVYGTGDDNCHYQNCEVLVTELVNHNKQFSQVVYPNCGHALNEGSNTRRHLYQTLTRYLSEYMPSGDHGNG
ncbi:MAG: S9 family peptidase [Verrucomicrobiales bacterium]|nr:S9 family peptidase [Akkermansiaceae bacterium]